MVASVTTKFRSKPGPRSSRPAGPRRSGRKVEQARNASRRTLLLGGGGALVLAALVFAVSTQLKGTRAPVPALPAVIPGNMADLDAELAEVITSQIAKVNANPTDAEQHAILGVIYATHDLRRRAHESYANAVQIDPGSALYAYHRARTDVDIERALNDLQTITSEHPEFAPAHCKLGDFLLSNGDTKMARMSFQRAADLSPAAPEPLVGLAEVHLRERRYAEAVELLNKAQTLDPNYRRIHHFLGQAYRGLGRAEDATRELELGLDAEKRSMPDRLSALGPRYWSGYAAHISRANELVGAGKYGQAASLLEELNRKKPGDADVLNNLAVAYLKLNRHEEALSVLMNAYRIDDKYFPTCINIVECLVALNRPEEAIRFGVRATEIAPGVGQAQFAKARALMGVQRFSEAREALQATLRLDARNPEAYLMMGEACYRLGQFEDAKENLAIASKRMPRYLPAHLNYCSMCIEAGDLAAAEIALQRARSLAPSHPRIAFLEGRIAERR